jgi:hypothetical protein
MSKTSKPLADLQCETNFLDDVRLRTDTTDVSAAYDFLARYTSNEQ